MNIPHVPLPVVEDIANILEMLAVTLRFKGYPVVTATNGQDALEAIKKERPALVITDILMPKMDGYSLMHNLRSDPLTRSIPVIFLSATYVTAEDKKFEESSVLAVKAGADIILKPSDVSKAIGAVVAAVERGVIPGARVEQSVRRELELKARSGVAFQRTVSLEALREVVGSAEHRAVATDIARRAITLLRDGGRSQSAESARWWCSTCRRPSFVRAASLPRRCVARERDRGW